MTESLGFDDILNSAREARRQLSDLEHEIQEKLDDIDFHAIQEGRPLHEDEKRNRQQLRAAQAETRDALVELAYVTLRRLDNSNEIQTLQQRIGKVNEELNEDLTDLENIENEFKKFQNIVKTVEEVVAGIAGLTSDEESANEKSESTESESTESESKKPESAPGEGETTSKKPSG